VPLTFREFLSRFGPHRSRQLHDSLARLELKLAGDLDSLRDAQQQTAKRVRKLSEDVRTLSRRLERQHKLQAKWGTSATWQFNALLRQRSFPSDIPFPYTLPARRFKLRSQHEEDGYLIALLAAVGSTTGRFVEIGCGKSGGNAALLAFELGWRGLMIDASAESIDYVNTVYGFNDTVTAIVAEVSPENINTLLQSHGFTGDVEVLSIDIDSYDYWVFEALEICSPRLLMLEYNAGFGKTRSVTIPKDAALAGAPKGYSGASLAALTKLAARKGYRLVACEYSGVNAFFLRDDVGPDIPSQPVERAFRPQMSRVQVEAQKFAPDEVLQRIVERNLPLQEV
jgi:hypothetical protein